MSHSYDFCPRLIRLILSHFEELTTVPSHTIKPSNMRAFQCPLNRVFEGLY
nr:MAG TPA: Fibroblast growth factor 13, Sodium hand and IQ motif.02A [Caudoviricetes sp.]